MIDQVFDRCLTRGFDQVIGRVFDRCLTRWLTTYLTMMVDQRFDHVVDQVVGQMIDHMVGRVFDRCLTRTGERWRQDMYNTAPRHCSFKEGRGTMA